MWGISPTIVYELLYIVIYKQLKDTSNRTYWLSCINLLIFILQQWQHTRALGRLAVWSELSCTPNFFTALDPKLYPQIVIGGGGSRGNVPSTDVCLYDMSGKAWKKLHHFQPLKFSWGHAPDPLVRACQVCWLPTLGKRGQHLSTPHFEFYYYTSVLWKIHLETKPATHINLFLDQCLC